MSLEYPCVHHKSGICYVNPEHPEPCLFGPCDNEISSRGDEIRRMSDEELSEMLVIEVKGLEECSLFLSAPTGRMFVFRAEAVRITLEWLCQPAKEE